MMKVKGNLIPHIYKPIISKALFDKVQEVFQSKSRDVFSHQQEYKAIQFAFRGLIKCDTCGCAITPEHKIKKMAKDMCISNAAIYVETVNKAWLMKMYCLNSWIMNCLAKYKYQPEFLRH